MGHGYDAGNPQGAGRAVGSGAHAPPRDAHAGSRRRGEARAERVGTIYGESGLLSGNAPPRLLRDGERVALIVGNHVFKRWRRREGPYWYQWSLAEDAHLAEFLTTLANYGSSDSGPGTGTGPRLDDPRGLPYAVSSVDLDENILVLEATRAVRPWPQRLVFSADRYDFTWAFDGRRTLEDDPGLRMPTFPSDLFVEFVVITAPTALANVPYALTQTTATLLGLPQSRVTARFRKAVDAGETNLLEESIVLEDGQTTPLRFRIRGAWGGTTPDVASLYLHPVPTIISQGWLTLRVGEERCVQTHGYHAGGSRFVFVRLLRSAQDV